MEIWDLYNENREIIGEQIRGEKLPENTFHLVVHVWIKNKKGKYLISQRNENKLTHPLMWECPGGAVIKGENSLDGAIRETMEEVGVDLRAHEGRLLFSKIRKSESDKTSDNILDVYIFEYDGEISLKNATTDEVAQVKWLDEEEIKDLYDSGKMVKSLYYFFDEIAKK